MDFNRSGQSRLTNTPATPAQAPQKPSVAPASRPQVDDAPAHGKLHRWSFIALLISGTVLFIAMIFFIVFGTPINREARFVDGKQYQAVFVNVNGTNGGQVYFGKITSLTSQYIRLTNVFYIQNQTQEGQASGSSYNLVKLGCELHGPTDEMLINRDQVFFWENLKSDSQVAQKAAEFYKQNPNGQKCDNNSSNSTQQSNTTTQNPAQTQTTPPAATPPASNGNNNNTNNNTNN